MTPLTPKKPGWPVLGGMNGCHRDGLMKNRPAPMKTRMMPILRKTMTELTVADSLMPRTRT